MATPLQHTDRERYGPGKLWIAPLGTIVGSPNTTFAPVVASSKFTQGTTSNAAVPGNTAWLPLGRTNDGMEFTWSIDTEEDTPAESYDPHKVLVTGRSCSLTASLRQINVTNLLAAFNNLTGTVTTPTATAFSRIAPPGPGSEVRAQLMWENDDNDMLIVMYQVLQVGELSLAGKKGAESMRIDVEFRGEVPSSSLVATVPAEILVAGVTYAATVSGD